MIRELRVSMEEHYEVSVEALTLDELKTFSKHECHMILWEELKEHVPGIPDLVCENETFWLSNAINNSYVTASRTSVGGDIQTDKQHQI